MSSIRVDLEADGFPGQWFEAIDIGGQSQNQFQKTAALAGETEGAQAFLATVITDWHILNPATGTPLPAPSSTGFDVGDVPLRALRRFGRHVREQFEDVVSDPKDASPNG